MINISLRQLEYFAAAAQHGGAARAAAALSVSQPSISKAIADLEALWGEALFVRRHARGLELTAAGQMRHREAHALLERARALEGPRTDEEAGLLRVGCLSTLAPRHLPAMLVRMRERHPQVEVEVHEGDTEALLQMLERGALDAALLYDMGLARPVRLEAVTAFVPYALLPAGHALAARTSLPVAALAQEPFILIDLPHSREYFLSLFRQAGVAPRRASRMRRHRSRWCARWWPTGWASRCSPRAPCATGATTASAWPAGACAGRWRPSRWSWRTPSASARTIRARPCSRAWCASASRASAMP